MLIGEVQKRFNSLFPYLKLEFYKSIQDIKNGMRMNEKKSIADGQQIIIDKKLDISPAMSVRALEKSFKDEFTLIAQVFRRSGNIWLQTTITDDWSLWHQNEHGKEITEGHQKNIKENPIDFDLDRDNLH